LRLGLIKTGKNATVPSNKARIKANHFGSEYHGGAQASDSEIQRFVPASPAGDKICLVILSHVKLFG
jgi:hypothetical protein